jgi:hypothetical protein
MLRQWVALAAAPASFTFAASASAQELDNDLVIQPAIPQDFNRGRNVSVQEQSRPDYSALGLRLGGFTLYPRVSAGAGATSNTYLTSQNENASVFLSQQASARLNSQWSRHSLQISGSTARRQYIGESRRNENLWAVDSSGRLDLRSALAIEANVNISRRLESLFSGEVTPTVAALSQYRRDYGLIRAIYTQGRVRTLVTVDRADFQFSPVDLIAGGVRDQSTRDRQISRLTAQVEYARSPSIAVFAQGSLTEIDYDKRPSADLQKLGSKSFRVLGGINADIAGRMRGTIGIGYSVRNYDAAIYKTVSGLLGEVQLQTFPTQRLTIGIDGRRSIEDITAGAIRPSIVTRASASVDYELLRNMILSASASYVNQRRNGDTYQATAGSRYLFSRRLSLQGTASINRRATNSVNEMRIEASLAYQL